MAASLQRGVPTTLLAAGSSGTTTGTAVVVPTGPMGLNCRVHVRGTGAIGAGNVIIEEASSPDATGTWSQIISLVGTTLAGGVEQVVHIAGGIGAIRARLAGITVGSVEVLIVAN